MATIILHYVRDVTWPADTQIVLMLGTPHAPSLEASTPPGGREAARHPAWPFAGQPAPGLGEGALGDGALGINNLPRGTVRYRYTPPPRHVACLLPVGLFAVDDAGNRSQILQELVQIDDPPRGARNLVLNPSPENITLVWSPSPGVPVDSIPV